MADYLRFKGAKDISHKKGSDMLLVRNPRGGDTTQVKRWWGTKQTVGYIKCAIFNVTSSVGALKLVIPTDPETTEVWIRHDGDGNFEFPYTRAIDRVAVFSDDLGTLYKEYQFSRISGGPTLTRTVQPLPGTGTTIGNVFITGPAVATVGTQSDPFIVFFDGGATDVQYNWSATDGSATFSGQNAETTTVTFAGTGSQTVFCEITSAGSTDSPQLAASTEVTVAATFAARAAAADLSYTVTVEQDGNGNDVYALNGNQQQAVALSVGETVAFDFSAVASQHPLGLFTDSTKTTPVTVGVEYGGTDNATLLFKPIIAANLSYQCINHPDMGGDITVS